MTKEEALNNKNTKWEEFCKARDEYNNLLTNDFKNKYLGQYIKWYDSDEDELNYMYVYNIWNSKDTSGPITENILYFEGVYFISYFSDYYDCTYVDWTQFTQHKFYFNDFNEETLEYKSYNNINKMSIITKDEFMKAFDKMIEKIIDEHHNFNYCVEDNTEDNAEDK